jgi:hypothetical protein
VQRYERSISWIRTQAIPWPEAMLRQRTQLAP